MALPKGLFAESRFRRSSADVALLAAATELTPNTAIAVACAAAYYLVEMFATQGDRDAPAVEAATTTSDILPQRPGSELAGVSDAGHHF
jgi:hypothetical protein